MAFHIFCTNGTAQAIAITPAIKKDLSKLTRSMRMPIENASSPPKLTQKRSQIDHKTLGHAEFMTAPNSMRCEKCKVENALSTDKQCWNCGESLERTEQWFAIIYEDADRHPELFSDAIAANHTFAQRKIAWNCHLFKRITPNPTPEKDHK